MSRRKQEKPQQRKLEEGEEGELFALKEAADVDEDDDMDSSDVLICGECQTEFQLDDIVRFIRHKVHKCNKENIPCRSDDEEEMDSDSGSPTTDQRICAKRPSISAPIGLGKADLKSQSLPMNLSMDSAGSEVEGRAAEVKTAEEVILDLKKVVDADTNTVNSEPYSFLCGTCKSRFDSAWMLVQHAQAAHGLKIYVDGNANNAVTLSSNNNNNNNTTSHNKNEPHFDKVPSIPMFNGQQMRSREHPSPRDGRGRDSREGRMEEMNQSAPAIITSSLTNGMSPVNHPNSRGGSAHTSPIKAPELPHHGPGLLNMEIGQPPNPFMFRMPLPGHGPERQPLSPMNGPFRPPGPMDFLHDPFHRMIGMPPHRLEAPHAPPGIMIPGPGMMERPRPIPSQALTPEQPMDFYSQRLRRLAGTNGPASMSEPSSPNKRQHTPPFSSAPASSSTPTPTPASSTTVSTVTSDSTEQLSPFLKPRSCDFCGKHFRFQSNLIVHRRSHTGEKPFKCTLCPHACTQASKLKRHMKTHSCKTPFGNNTIGMSRSSSPDSTGMNNDESSDEDEEDEEEEEMDMDEVEPSHHHQPHDLSSRKSDSSVDSDDLPMADRQALLAEVMEKSGLSGIEAYNEAFQQALAEKIAENNNRGGDLKDAKPLENGLPFGREQAEKIKRERDEKRDIVESPFRFNPLMRQHPNRLKMEPSEQHLANMDALYSNIWFPPTANPRDVFMHGPMRGGVEPQHPLLRHPQNGGPPHSAFLESLHTGPPPGLHRPPPGLISHSPHQHTPRPQIPQSDRKSNRSDSCEYCGKVFKNCSNLTVHRRSHTGEKPYRCELCSYACAQSSKLTRHMRTHCRDGKDVYRCKFCNMPFSVPSTLEKHMRKCVENHNLKMESNSMSSSPLSMDASLGLDMSMAKSSLDMPMVKPSPSQSV